MGAAAGTQAGGDGVQFVAAARKLLVENPDMEYEAVLKALGPLPPGVTVNESAVERVRALAESSETDAKLWDVVVAAMNEKQSSGKSSRMTQKLDADGFKNVKKAGGGSGGAAPDVELAAGEQGSPETTYLISPEFKRAHSKKSVPYPPLADNKARPFDRKLVGSFSCHGQSDVGKYKENQDRGVVCFPFACKPSDERRALFIVADGHGEYGHTVSDYVVKFLVKNLANKKLDNFDPGSIAYQEIKDAFVETNQVLFDVPGLDSSTSGTTLVAAIMKPTFIITANVGDSRCVLGQTVGPAPPASKVPTLYRAKDLGKARAAEILMAMLRRDDVGDVRVSVATMLEKNAVRVLLRVVTDKGPAVDADVNLACVRLLSLLYDADDDGGVVQRMVQDMLVPLQKTMESMSHMGEVQHVFVARTADHAAHKHDDAPETRLLPLLVYRSSATVPRELS